MTDDWKDLEDPIDQIPMKKAATKVEFDCIECGGTGKWSRGHNSYGNDKCRTCGGRGKVVTDPFKLRKQRADRAVKRGQEAMRKDMERKANLAQFEQDQPAMFAELFAIHSEGFHKNDFLLSLATQLFDKGVLSDRQIAAWHRGKEKLEAIRKEREEAAPNVDLAPVWDMFNTALESGYKRPVYRAEGLKISKAPMHGRNPGALYVVRLDDDQYLGKVVDGKYFGKAEGEVALLEIAKDPKDAAIRYGQRTGTCACCGRLLTKHASIELGIGPICAEKWGF